MRNFQILSSLPISSSFLNLGISDFHSATKYIKHMPYGRNADKSNLRSIFIEHMGTCSTKHAVLKVLADENGQPGIRLMLGIFRMNGQNTPPVAERLKSNGLEYIPEAHNYLIVDNEYCDFTSAQSVADDFLSNLDIQIEIDANQICDYKVEFHRKYLTEWLKCQNTSTLSLDKLWKIREDCILDLSAEKL